MKNFYCLLFFLVTTASYTFGQNFWKSGIVGEGSTTSKEFSVSDFDGIRNGFACHVILTQGPTFKVTAEGQQNVLDNLILDVRDKTLTIKYDRPVKRAARVNISITMPDLELVALSGSGSIETTRHFADLDDLDIRVSGSGRINLDIEAEDVDNRISGSGSITLLGSAEHVVAQISGSGRLKAEDLRAQTGKFSISGSGHAYVHVDDEIDANISGSGHVKYKGAADKVKSRVSGSGSLRKI